MSVTSNIQSLFSLPPEVISITIDLNGAGNSMDCLFLRKKKDGIHVVTDFEFNSLNLKKHPILLTLTGKGVLYKSINKPLSKVRSKDILPSSNESDFFWCKTGNEKQSVIGIIRKELIANVIREFDLPVKNIINVVLGPLAYNTINGVDLNIPETIQGLDCMVSNGLITTITKSHKTTSSTFLGESISKKSQLGYLSGIEYLLTSSPSEENEYKTNLENLKSKSVFKKVGIACLAILLIVFMGNAVLYKVISEENNHSRILAQQQKQLVKDVDLLREEIKSKKALQQKLNLHSPPTYSFYLDEIGKTVPAEIQLTKLTVNPLSKVLKPNQIVTFNSSQLQIEGVSKNTIDVNIWKRNLSKLNWVKRLELTDLKRSKNNNNSFLIQIDF